MKLIKLNEKSIIYARPDGWHYHLTKDCPMLSGGEFKKLNYRLIAITEVKERKLIPCSCAYENWRPKI